MPSLKEPINPKEPSLVNGFVLMVIFYSVAMLTMFTVVLPKALILNLGFLSDESVEDALTVNFAFVEGTFIVKAIWKSK